MSSRTKTNLENTILVLLMFRSMTFHTATMELAVFNQDHTYPMVTEEIIHITAITGVIEVEVIL